MLKQLILCSLFMGLLLNIHPQSFNFKYIEKNFENPPNEYRITQYQLTPGTLNQYPKYGIGGSMAFFYSIIYPASKTENYKLGEKGPAIIGELLDAAQDLDYKVWLADDWGYPSGMAGGRVVAENPDFEVKGLTMITVMGYGSDSIIFALPADLYDIVYAAIYPRTGPMIERKTNRVIESEVDLKSGESIPFSNKKINVQGLEKYWQLRVYARYVRDKDVQAQSTMKQFGHSGRYPDLMNKEAVSRFIANMHEPLLSHIKEPAKSVEGFYTNEPNLMQSHWKWEPDAPYACVPWSEELPEQFKKMNGYDIYSILPYLYEGDDDKARRARIHYRQAVTQLLADSYPKQIREWCNAKGIKSSGHFLLNDYLAMHVQSYGDMMKFVSEYDVPALDIPIPNPDEYAEFPYQQTRFFSSVTSWKELDMTIMLLDPIIGGYGLSRLSPDLPLLINSINMACFHGANMFTSYLPLDPKNKTNEDGTRHEIAKGYTPEEYTFLNEYTGRLALVLRGAHREAKVALYYPIAMFQADLKATEKFWPYIISDNMKRQNAWDETEKTLIKDDVEYMIVHPEGVVESDINDGQMEIGYGSYHTLIMPQLDFIPLAVVNQLEKFEAQGGKVIWVDNVPIGAEHSENDAKVKAYLEKVKKVDKEGLTHLIRASFSEDFDFDFSTATNQLNVGRFHQGAKQVYLLVNREQQPITIEIKKHNKEKKAVKVLNPSTGKISDIMLPSKLQLEANRSLLLMPGR